VKKDFCTLLLFAITLTVTVNVFGQNKPLLGVLPFAGGMDGDGETIVTLLSLQRDIQESFIIVPRTNAVNAILDEQSFQLSGYTDSDTIARLGRMLNADFVVSGHIRRLGDRNLIITTIINVETFEMLAGDYREYRNIEEIIDLLPIISNKMIVATQRDTSRLPKLAVSPFQVNNREVNEQDAEVLAQILSVELTNTGRFAVLPRTATMQAALRELEYQRSGYTADEGAKAMGRAANAEYVLSADVRSLGSVNLFIAQILHAEDGRQIEGGHKNYRTVTDGIRLMPELAQFLTDRVRAEAEARIRKKHARAKYWSIGVSVGTSFADPLLIGTLRGTIAPFPYSFLELGFDVGFISDKEWATGYYSLYPFANYALFLPFPKKGGWYIGAGCGYMFEEYRVDDWVEFRGHLAANFSTGINIGNIFDISYTLRTNFSSVNNKLAIGLSYRFK
jgi:TolB-like protein